MNIAIDIDDTLTLSFDYFLPFVAEFFGVDVEDLKKRNISYGNLPDEWKKDELAFCQAYYDRVVPATPFKEDALFGVNALREMGHKIFIITARNTELYTDPYKTTMEELKNGGIMYDKLICTLDKGTACEQENISLLIDDSITNCNSAKEHGVNALLFTSKANKDTETTFTRVSCWKDVIDIVSQL